MSAQLGTGRGVWCVSRWLAAVLVVATFQVGTAWAQEGEVDEEPPLDLIDPGDLSSPQGQVLQQAVGLAQQGSYAAATLQFYNVFSDSGSSESLMARAQYELAKSLYRMGLYYGALYYLDGIAADGPDNPYFYYAYPWLLRLWRRLPGEPDALGRLSFYDEFYPDAIATKYLDIMAMLIGEYYYANGDLDGAEYFLQDVSPVSRHYPRSQFLLGVLYVQQYEGQFALDAFTNTVQWIVGSEDREAEAKNMGEAGILSLARTFYSTRDFERAIQYYEQVPASSRYWLDALFERSWALFQQGEYNRALGNLHSLNSPFFNDEFYPEAMVLQAVIFFQNCNFMAVRETAEEFDLEYLSLLDQLEDMVATVGTDQEYFDLVIGLRQEVQADFSPQLQRILNTVLADKVVDESLQFVDELDREMLILDSMDPGWQESYLADDVITETGFARSIGVGRVGENAQIRIRRARDELRSLYSQTQAILVETDLAEQAVISANLRSELNRSDAGLEPPTVDDQHLFWRFRGEYWRDELGYYWYALRSRCEELGL